MNICVSAGQKRKRVFAARLIRGPAAPIFADPMASLCDLTLIAIEMNKK